MPNDVPLEHNQLLNRVILRELLLFCEKVFNTKEKVADFGSVELGSSLRLNKDEFRFQEAIAIDEFINLVWRKDESPVHERGNDVNPETLPPPVDTSSGSNVSARMGVRMQ